MGKFEITAPNGEVFEIEGDTVPSEIELDNIFQEMGANEPKKGIDLTPTGIKHIISPAVGGTLTRMVKGEKPKEAWNNSYNQALDKYNQYQKEHPIISKIDKGVTDTASYMAIPYLRANSSAPLLAKGGAFAGNAVLQGGVPMGLEAMKEGEDFTNGLGTGTGIAATINGAMSTIPYAGKFIKKGIENPIFHRNFGKVIEGLTSVPAKYSERALDKEIKGETLFNGKFDTDTAYQPIERKLREAKNVLPSNEDFAKEFYNLGDKAVNGMNAIKDKATNKISAILEKLNNKEVKNNGIKNAVNSVINSFGKGGVYNSAKRNAPRVVNFLDEELAKEGLTLRDLHRIKKDLYDIGYQSAGLKEGTQAEVARGTAEQINNYLRNIAPDYIAPNDRYSLIANIERGLDNENTIARKIRDIGSENNILRGLDQQLKNVDNLLPKESKFYNQAKELIDSQDEINNIRKVIGQQYERNPRLLGNRTDEAFEQALEDLQRKSNVNFMDDLENIRAREALERFFPGQGGGSGSSQGFGNLLRTSIIGGAPTAAAITHNPLVLAGLGIVSPKIMAKGTIQNLGRIYNSLGKEIPENIRRFLTPAAVVGSAPLLYGGISNLEE